MILPLKIVWCLVVFAVEWVKKKLPWVKISGCADADLVFAAVNYTFGAVIYASSVTHQLTLGQNVKQNQNSLKKERKGKEKIHRGFRLGSQPAATKRDHQRLHACAVRGLPTQKIIGLTCCVKLICHKMCSFYKLFPFVINEDSGKRCSCNKETTKSDNSL